MNMVVLVAGVHDPKWPIAPEAAASEVADRRIMSPFDEAAVEMALRARDAGPATRIAVRVAGGVAAIRIARAILALNISDVATFAVERPWDQAAVARALVPLCHGADLVLIGREFGDFDDGLVPSILAGLLGARFFGRAQTISTDGGLGLMRENGAHAERVLLSAPLVASVTNDRRTRLRKPLMKNVMQARHSEVGEVVTGASSGRGLALHAITPASGPRASMPCAMLAGTIEQQARTLADLLWEARA